MKSFETARGRGGDGAMLFRRVAASPCLRVAFVCLFFVGCKSPGDRTRDASTGGGTGSISGSGNLVVFSNELKTGGGVFFYPGGENQSISFADTSNSVSARSIRYTWNGQSVANQIVFAGFDLMHVVDNTPTLTVYQTTPGRDLRAANYKKVNFYARGNLSSNTFLKVEVSDDGNTNTKAPCLALSPNGDLDDVPQGAPCGTKAAMGTSWSTYSIPITSNDLRSVKDLFKATLVFLGGGNIPGGGGTVYFDNIEYTP